jgi:hypothetical protein
MAFALLCVFLLMSIDTGFYVVGAPMPYHANAAAYARIGRGPYAAAYARIGRGPYDAAYARIGTGPYDAAYARIGRGPVGGVWA